MPHFAARPTLKKFALRWGALVGLLAAVLAAAVGAAESETSSAEAPVDGQVWGGPRQYEALELTPIVNRALKGGRDYARGEQLFQTVGCAFCHHFLGGAGGIGPELSGVGGRFGAYTLLQEIIDPSTYISDLFGTKMVMRTDGRSFTGRVLTENGQGIVLSLNFTVDPSTGTATWDKTNTVEIPADEIRWVDDSGISPMPRGLLNTLKEDEISDLVAYLLSNGDPTDRMFKPLPAANADQ